MRDLFNELQDVASDQNKPCEDAFEMVKAIKQTIDAMDQKLRAADINKLIDTPQESPDGKYAVVWPSKHSRHDGDYRFHVGATNFYILPETKDGKLVVYIDDPATEAKDPLLLTADEVISRFKTATLDSFTVGDRQKLAETKQKPAVPSPK